MMSQEKVFESISKKYPNLNFYHSSGGLPDIKGVGTSDVDISFPLESLDETLLLELFKEDHCKVTERGEGYLIISLLNYCREVNVYVSKSPLNACTHRRNELWLNKTFPELVPQAFALKKFAGYSTEEAWAKVLELEGNPYQAMLNFNILKKQGDSALKCWNNYIKNLSNGHSDESN